jgi:tetratricopeptide (TPR) repeat protein
VRVLKWLFQPVYLLLIIVVVALYVNREAIFPEEVTESLEVAALSDKVESLVERLRSAQEQPLAEVQPAAVESEPPAPEVEATVEASIPPAEDSALPQPPQPEPVAEQEMPAVGIVEEASSDIPQAAVLSEAAESVVTEEAPAEAAVTTVSSLPAPETDISPPPVESTSLPVAVVDLAGSVSEEAPAANDTADTEESIVAQPAPAMPPLAIWRAARAAVWQGDLSGAVAHYRQLIVLQPDNFDAYGEMGNVLLAQADTAGALEAYVSAARLIHQAGYREMAYRLASVVAGMDEERGRELFSEFAQEKK